MTRRDPVAAIGLPRQGQSCAASPDGEHDVFTDVWALSGHSDEAAES